MPVIGSGGSRPLPMEGALPPDLQGTLFRAGPGTRVDAGAARAADDIEGAMTDTGSGDVEAVAAAPGAEAGGGALHAIELRDGRAVSYLHRASPGNATVLWHAGSVLALPERGLPFRYSRHLEPAAFTGGLTVPVASHLHRDASDGARVLFAVDDGMRDARPGAAQMPPEDADRGEGVWLRIGEWDADGAMRAALAVELERATWQHDIGLTAHHVVFIESPTTRLADDADADADAAAVPYGWVPGAGGWVGIVRRGGDGSDVRWAALDPCLVTHVLGATDVDDGVVLVVCTYPAPEEGQPVDRSVSVVAPAGVGLTSIGGGLGTLERWRISGDRIERTPLDERPVEYPRIDAACEAGAFRYGYCVETAWDGVRPVAGAGAAPGTMVDGACRPTGLLQFDFDREEVAAWSPGEGKTCSEPVFVRAADGRGDDEGWLLTIVGDPDRGASDLYVLDASTLGRRRPEAVVHLPQPLPPRSHGEWVPADRYR